MFQYVVRIHHNGMMIHRYISRSGKISRSKDCCAWLLWQSPCSRRVRSLEGCGGSPRILTRSTISSKNNTQFFYHFESTSFIRTLSRYRSTFLTTRRVHWKIRNSSLVLEFPSCIFWSSNFSLGRDASGQDFFGLFGLRAQGGRASGRPAGFRDNTTVLSNKHTLLTMFKECHSLKACQRGHK